MKRIIFEYSNAEFYLDLKDIRKAVFKTPKSCPNRTTLTLKDGFIVSIYDKWKTTNFKTLMSELHDSPSGTFIRIKCEGLTATDTLCTLDLADWVQQAMG